jgi:YD repeat-containing protein
LHSALPSSDTIALGYDGVGRLASIDYSDSTPDVTFGYDENGNRTEMVDGAGSESYS